MGQLRLEEMRAPAPIVDDSLDEIYISGGIVETYCQYCCVHGILLTDWCNYCNNTVDGSSYIPSRQWECIHSGSDDDE